MEHRLKDDQVVELLLRNRASYVPTLCLIKLEENSAEVRYANLKQVADAGVRVALGTDSFCGLSKFGEDTIEEAERSAQAGIGTAQVLRMATKDAAAHLGMDDLGVVAPGKIADLAFARRRSNDLYRCSPETINGNPEWRYRSR